MHLMWFAGCTATQRVRRDCERQRLFPSNPSPQVPLEEGNCFPKSCKIFLQKAWFPPLVRTPPHDRSTARPLPTAGRRPLSAPSAPPPSGAPGRWCGAGRGHFERGEGGGGEQPMGCGLAAPRGGGWAAGATAPRAWAAAVNGCNGCNGCNGFKHVTASGPGISAGRQPVAVQWQPVRALAAGFWRRGAAGGRYKALPQDMSSSFIPSSPHTPPKCTLRSAT